MDKQKLISIFTEIQKEFQTIEKVEDVEGKKRIDIILRDFSPKNEKNSFQISAAFFEEHNTANEFAEMYHQNRQRVEIFFTAGTYPLDSSDLILELKFLSQISLHHTAVNIHLIEDQQEKEGTILCRSVIPLRNESENLQNDILFSLKDMLAMHYRVKLGNAITKLKATGLDEDMEKVISDKYKMKIEHLINPETEL